MKREGTNHLSAELAGYAENIWRRFPEIFISLGSPDFEDKFEIHQPGAWSQNITETITEKTIELKLPRKVCRRQEANDGVYLERRESQQICRSDIWNDATQDDFDTNAGDMSWSSSLLSPASADVRRTDRKANTSLNPQLNIDMLIKSRRLNSAFNAELCATRDGWPTEVSAMAQFQQCALPPSEPALARGAVSALPLHTGSDVVCKRSAKHVNSADKASSSSRRWPRLDWNSDARGLKCAVVDNLDPNCKHQGCAQRKMPSKCPSPSSLLALRRGFVVTSLQTKNIIRPFPPNCVLRVDPSACQLGHNKRNPEIPGTRIESAAMSQKQFGTRQQISNIFPVTPDPRQARGPIDAANLDRLRFASMRLQASENPSPHRDEQTRLGNPSGADCDQEKIGSESPGSRIQRLAGERNDDSYRGDGVVHCDSARGCISPGTRIQHLACTVPASENCNPFFTCSCKGFSSSASNDFREEGGAGIGIDAQHQYAHNVKAKPLLALGLNAVHQKDAWRVPDPNFVSRNAHGPPHRWGHYADVGVSIGNAFDYNSDLVISPLSISASSESTRLHSSGPNSRLFGTELSCSTEDEDRPVRRRRSGCG